MSDSTFTTSIIGYCARCAGDGHEPSELDEQEILTCALCDDADGDKTDVEIYGAGGA